ncbi:WG repeat-containing protein [Pontimicrobium aquaticum]|uniref:WG repeat-containing protein n=1 Tax=Pontimicrobium aquaticum TaxID=2565367 RepID=A0A4V5LQU7_9FLAO|nr:WG repeat-containing protein [Pontimicrobium aquaticum]TJY35769.1 WG repeat-containing protein [Pontimicrobium aquaticum]
MKKVIIMFTLLVVIPISSFSQTIENIDYISPFNEGVAAIKKNNQWAFINKVGDIVINFRNDLVVTASVNGNYPIFNSGRCLIVKKENGISYFGYIDSLGNTAIEPQFLNATAFNNNVATALKLEKEEVGKNTALNKGIVYYKYFEVVIDINGTIKTYLTQKGVNIALDRKFLRKPPKFLTKQLSNNLIAVKSDNGKWTIKKIIE